MKFKFPLQTVMKHRKIKEDLAQKDFQEARVRLDQQIQILENMKQQLHDSFTFAGQSLQRGGNATPSLVQNSDFRKLQEIRIKKQEQKVQEHRILVEEKQEVLRQAALEYKIMERLREKKHSEYIQQRNLEEQKEMDEMSVLRFDADGEK